MISLPFLEDFESNLKHRISLIDSNWTNLKRWNRSILAQTIVAATTFISPVLRYRNVKRTPCSLTLNLRIFTSIRFFFTITSCQSTTYVLFLPSRSTAVYFRDFRHIRTYICIYIYIQIFIPLPYWYFYFPEEMISG